jgi:hypothetical protein
MQDFFDWLVGLIQGAAQGAARMLGMGDGSGRTMADTSSVSSSSGLSARRERILARVAAVVPSAYPSAQWKMLAPAYDPANLPSAGYTTCGELPRYALGAEGINTRGGLASIKTLAESQGAWRTPGSGDRPKPGDAYLLGTPQGAILHTGIIIDSTGDTWKTADAGQGPKDAQAAAYLDRPWDESAKTLGGPAGPRTLIGWLDVDAFPDVGVA